MKRVLILSLHMAALIGLSGMAIAQTQVTVTAKPLTESDIALLRQDVQSVKEAIITKNMQFTDQEAAGFWPIYRDYAKDQLEIGDTKYHIILDYAQSYDGMSDAKASELTARMIELDKAVVETRAKYLPRFQKVLAPKRVAKFYQVDRRLSLMIDLELASVIPILE
jgi:hypothetical protein